MKKIATLLTCIVLLASCKQQFENNVSENGTVVIDLSSNIKTRAIGENGLPEIASSKMEIIITADGSSPIKKEYNEGDEKKYSGQFPVGSKIKCTVIISNKSGKWKGRAEHVVQKGENHLQVKLRKAAASLEALKFKIDEDFEGQGLLIFYLGFEGKPPFFTKSLNKHFYKEVSTGATSNGSYRIPAFCRDRLGRTYIFYAPEIQGAAETYEMKRYTSEGEPDDKFIGESFSGIQIEIMNIVADKANDDVYAIWRDLKIPESNVMITRLDNEGKKIDEGKITGVRNIQAVAVHNGVFAIVEKVYAPSGAVTGTKLVLYGYKEGVITPLSEGMSLHSQTKAQVENETGENKDMQGAVQDIFMKDSNIYVLYNFTNGEKIATFGGILKYSYKVEEGRATLNEGKRIFGKDKYKEAKKVISVEDEKNEFYGALKFVGFNEKELYIADDGVNYDYDAGVINVIENKNRLVTFNLNEEKIKVKDEKTESWMPEKEAINKDINPVLFYSAENFAGGKDYSLTIHLNREDGIENNPISLGNASAYGSLEYVFDNTGNLYISSDNDLIKYTREVGRASGTNYRKNSISLGITGDEGARELYYDVVTQELYVDIENRNESEKSYIARYTGDGNFTALTGDYPKSGTRVIHNSKLYKYDYKNNKFIVYKIEKDKVELTSLEIETGLKEEDDINGFFAYDNTLFLNYIKASDKAMYVLAINLKDNSKSEKKLYDSDMGLAGEEYINPIGHNRKTKELYFLVDLYKKDYDERYLENINKWASVKKEGDSVKAELKAVPQGITWDKEFKVWQSPKEVILFNTVSIQTRKAEYYAVKEGDVSNPLPSEASLKSGDGKTFYDAFCYDQLGNFYVLAKKDNDYYILQFKLKDSGKYDFTNIDDKFNKGLKIGDPLSIEVEKFIMAVSNLPDDVSRLYYGYTDTSGNFLSKAYEFENDKPLKDATLDTKWDVKKDAMGENLENGWVLKTNFLSITANKDGVFFAVKEVEGKNVTTADVERKYNIKVLKYPHYDVNGLTINYGSLISSVDVVGTSTNRIDPEMFKGYNDADFTEQNHTWNDYIQEFVGDMYAYNGSLYALTYKKIGASAYDAVGNWVGNVKKGPTETHSKGSVLKVGKDTGSFTGEVTTLHTSESKDIKTSGKMCPRRFIGVLKNDLPIASDGFYGYVLKKEGDPENNKRKGVNFDNVLFLSLTNPESLQEKTTQAKFFFKLKESGYENVIDYWMWDNQ